MTGTELAQGDGIWEDGEWISWDWINAQIADEDAEDPCEIEEFQFESREGFPYSVIEHTQVFLDLIECARRYVDNTGRYLQIWGELGEMYAEIKFGLRRHASLHRGSDGTIGGKRVEVKTISPEKKSDRVRVKASGDFEQLLIVKIDADFAFQAKLFERAQLRGVNAAHQRARFGAP
jgi:hypothetical protein